MKTKLIKKLSITISAIAFVTIIVLASPDPRHHSTTPQYIIDEQNNIVGTWISEKDSDWKLVFSSDGKCYDYYSDVLVTTSTYTISNTSPKCGINVLVDESRETSYLELTDINDGTSLCYDINGVTSLLSLTTVGTGNLIVLTKQ